jgi:alanyl-tRNA synthetase
MQPFMPYLLGAAHPEGVRIADSQKCFRSGDIEEVGDNRHTTFFEMLGNWSLGDYFKAEQLPFFFNFLTDPVDGVGLDPKKLYVTTFIGDEKNGTPKDTESIAIWKELFAAKGITANDVEIGSEADGYKKGMFAADGSEHRIFAYDAKKNWWSRAGVPENMPAGEPGGPDSEVFYDFGPSTSSGQAVHDTAWGEHCHPNCDCGRFVEIGNSVFMQYIKQADGSFALLPKQNVDFGGGLERIVMAAQHAVSGIVGDVFTSNHAPIIAHIEEVSGKKYTAGTTTDAGEVQLQKSFRIICDHMKAAVFLIEDGVLPSNVDQGYFVRRLIRRSVMHANQLGIEANTFAQVVRPIAAMYKDAYPDLGDNAAEIEKAVSDEESKFRAALARGLKEFEKMATAAKLNDNTISGRDAYVLFTTHGFPVEVTEEVAKAQGLKVHMEAFKTEMLAHKDASRSGSEQKFKGGLADQSEQTTRLHTTHHLLLKALQLVLGPHVKQRGSNITGERLRIDFSHTAKMTEEEKRQVEDIVNENIQKHLPMNRNVMKKEDAEQLNAEHEFGAKYPDTVTVYSLGPVGATLEDPQFDKAFSIEFCGGPHVTNTSQIAEAGVFKIQKEEAVAAGIRRIKGVLVS